MNHIPDAATVTGWRKSTHSGANGNCVEFAALPDGTVGMRDSKNPTGPALSFDRSAIAALLAGAKAGEFDDLA